MTVPELPLAMRTDFNVFLEKAFAELTTAPFLPNWHLERLAWECWLFANGVTRRLIICMPPRHLKSTIGSVALPGTTRRAAALTMSDGTIREAHREP